MAEHPVTTNKQFAWLLLFVALLLAATSGIGLWHGMLYWFGDAPAAGKVIEFHAAQSRSRSIIGNVEVTMPGRSPFRAQVGDNLGSQDWEVGGTIVLRCTDLRGTQPTCSADTVYALLLVPTLFTAIFAGLAWWALRRIRRRTRSIS